MNKHSFFSWQGNADAWRDWYSYVFLAIGFLILIILFLLKDKIRSRFQRGGKFLFFSSDMVMWRVIGIVGFILSVFRLILCGVEGYPLRWELLSLHLCRLHILLIFIFLAFGKLEWIKYFTYIALVGVFFAFLFGHERSDFINWVNVDNNKTGNLTNDVNNFISSSGNAKFEPNSLERIGYKDGIEFYNVGFDSWWTYDFILAHLSLIVIPLVIRSGYGFKFTKKELAISSIYYLIATLFMWLLNIGMHYSPGEHWRANNWYIGLDVDNDNKEALGPLSLWPQNLFAYSAIGLSVNYLFHYAWMWLDKYHFFVEEKFISTKKSRHYNQWKEEKVDWKHLFKH